MILIALETSNYFNEIKVYDLLHPITLNTYSEPHWDSFKNVANRIKHARHWHVLKPFFS